MNKVKSKYIFFQWGAYGKSFLEAEFELLGFETIPVGFPDKNIIYWTIEEENEALAELKNEIKKDGILFVFSFNYFDRLSCICYEHNVKYLSWTYDSPWNSLKSNSVAFDTSYIFVFDSLLVKQAQAYGAKHIHYLALASHPAYYHSLTPPIKSVPKSDVSFVGSLYENRAEFGISERYHSKYLDGYLEGLIKAQDNFYGMNLIRFGFNDEISELLNTAGINHKINIFHRFGEYEESISDFLELQTDYRATQRMRQDIAVALSAQYDFLLYTESNVSEFPHIKVHEPVEAYTVAPFVYKNSKINLNLTLLSINNGIPFRCFEIMAAGGFLLSNYQKDFDEHFKDGVHYASFSDMEELTDKIDFYLRNETKRKRVAANGYEEIIKNHTTGIRARQMLETAGIL